MIIAGKSTMPMESLRDTLRDTAEDSECLCLFPRLSTQGLSVLVSAAQVPLVPGGISSRIATQAALGLGLEAPSRYQLQTKAGPTAALKSQAQQPGKKEKSKGKTLSKPQTQQALGNPVLAGLIGENSRLHGGPAQGQVDGLGHRRPIQLCRENVPAF